MTKSATDLTRRDFNKAAVATVLTGLFGQKAQAETKKIPPEKYQKSEISKALMLGDGQRFIDQDGELFDPASLNGKTVIALSGFHGCPVCDQITHTLVAAQKKLDSADDAQIIMLDYIPKRDDSPATRRKYADYYEERGLAKGSFKILFAEKETTKDHWVPDDDVAKAAEKKLMKNIQIQKGHSTKVMVFTPAGVRVGVGTHAAIDPENHMQQDIKAEAIVNDVNKARAAGIGM